MTTDEFLPQWIAEELATCEPAMLAGRILAVGGAVYGFDRHGLAVGRLGYDRRVLAHVPSLN